MSVADLGSHCIALHSMERGVLGFEMQASIVHRMGWIPFVVGILTKRGAMIIIYGYSCD